MIMMVHVFVLLTVFAIFFGTLNIKTDSRG
jgi:hypothetical protein